MIMKHTLSLVLSLILLFNVSIEPISAKQKKATTNTWTGTWATAAQPVDRPNMPPQPGLSNNTFRQIIRVSIGGEKVRLQLSNLFSKNPTTIKSIAIANALEGSAIDKKSSKTLTFNGKKSVTLAPNSETKSDPLSFKLKPGSRLAITVCYGEVSADITGHPASRTTSYLVAGNKSVTPDFSNAVKADRWYTINRLDVLSDETAGAIVVLGNSIADGRGSGINKQNRWPDVLSERLLQNPSTTKRGVLNVSIGGSSALSGSKGLSGMDRLERDVFTQSNVKWLIVTIGVNDLGGTRSAERADAVADRLIDFYQQVIEKAHAKGIKVYGVPILPFGKSFYDAAYRQPAWEKINQWIRTSGKFDAVIDFEPKMRNPEIPNSLLPNLHDNDYLHPNQAGYRIMGETPDVKLFE